MEPLRAWTGSLGWGIVWPLAVGAAVFTAASAVRWALFARLQKLAEKTSWSWDDLVVAATKGPALLWCLIAAIYAAVVAAPVSEGLQRLASQTLSILWLISLIVAMLRLSDQVIRRYGDRLSTALPLTSLTQNLAKGSILVIGFLMVLNSLGVSITPVLTALGVGGLAVALALQDTLSNLFSGIYVTAARQVRVGDYVKLDSGEEGYVADITWRSTRIRTLSNNLIIVPNTKVAQAIVTNYDLPSQDLTVLVEVGVDYRSDLEKVERVTCDVIRDVMKTVPGGMPDFEPMIRYHTFGEYTVKFTAILRGKAFVDQYLVKHEFIKRLHRRYALDGITIPFPIQTVITEPGQPLPTA